MRRYACSRTSLLAAVAILVLAAASPAAGQSAVFAGAVVRDTLGHGLSGALITILGTNRSDTSDARGEFKFTNLAAGKRGIVIRRVGFQPMVDTVDLIDGRDVEREYVMDPVPVSLDSVRVVATNESHLSPQMSQFEDDRKWSPGGHFLTEQQIAANEQRAMQDILVSMMPGLHVFRPLPKERPTMEYLSSGRGNCNGPVFQCGASECPVLLYVNGAVRTDPAFDKDPHDWEDFNTMRATEIEAVEYFAGAATIPQRYNMTGNSCGVLVLWTREGPRKP